MDRGRIWKLLPPVVHHYILLILQQSVKNQESKDLCYYELFWGVPSDVKANVIHPYPTRK